MRGIGEKRSHEPQGNCPGDFVPCERGRKKEQECGGHSLFKGEAHGLKLKFSV